MTIPWLISLWLGHSNVKKPTYLILFLLTILTAGLLTGIVLGQRVLAQSETPIYMPMLMRDRQGSISGRVTINGAPAVNVFVDLINERNQVVSTAVTDSSGRYAFLSPPGLSPGQTYQVDYEDFDQSVDTNGWLYAFTTQPVTQYERGTELQMPAFDVADIVMIAPPEFASVALPYTFIWEKRTVPQSESYFLRIICNSLAWEFRNLGYTDRVTISGDDPGLYGPDADCYWDLGVVTRFGEGYNSELRFIYFID